MSQSNTQNQATSDIRGVLPSSVRFKKMGSAQPPELVTGVFGGEQDIGLVVMSEGASSMFVSVTDLIQHLVQTRPELVESALAMKVQRQHELLQQAQDALSTCKMNYSEYNQFEGEWNADFSEKKVHDALSTL